MPSPTAPMQSTEPFWWEAAPLQPALQQRPVEDKADVVVVGAGYTGLSAAITLARAGRKVVVFDKQRPGEGASSRNGGITSGNLRLSVSEMTERFGAERALAIQAEAKAAREDLYQFIEAEELDCDFALTGRFAGAISPDRYDSLAREADLLRQTLGIEAYPVSRADQRDVLGTALYHGGSVRMDIGGLHPAKLHAGMLRLALEAGVSLHAETGVLGLRAEGEKHEVETARGRIVADCVVSGSNGYTDASDPWLRRRLVPVRSRIIATAPLSPNMMGALMPRRMMCSDSRKISFYYRPSPDGTRILFGGRDGTIAGDAGWPTEFLRRNLVEIFPELGDVPITHSWFGHVAMNRDMVPRIFSRHGVRYAAGYCGSGVVWARWAGQKVALQILGGDGTSALDFRPPSAVPLYNGKPWFMPAVFAWLSWQDRRAARARGG
ncbi:NAD(P)/FAD-dependent oxidoreductase [Pseudoroseomonas globiformis]|uniref:NAD(P)/FAD-dependent oxidoreductase n=1 Tax=Teichococcus globiformis TaxID=2307229 RepID=A0ABV7G512_9PROT